MSIEPKAPFTVETVESTPDTSPPSRRTSAFTVQSADDFNLEAAPTAHRTGLKRRWLRAGDITWLRFVTKQLVVTHIHFGVKLDEGDRVLLCNGSVCAICLAKNKPVAMCLLPAFWIDDRELGVLSFEKGGGPGSLYSQILPAIKQPNYPRAIFELSKSADNKRHTLGTLYVRPMNKPDPEGEDYGDEELGELIVKGLPTPEELVATYDHFDNQEILASSEWVSKRVRTYHPGLDLSTL